MTPATTRLMAALDALGIATTSVCYYNGEVRIETGESHGRAIEIVRHIRNAMEAVRLEDSCPHTWVPTSWGSAQARIYQCAVCGAHEERDVS